jgi:hypothetical protein
VKTYVQPAWMPAAEAEAHARGETVPVRAQRPATILSTENTVNETEARELRAENERLRRDVKDLTERLELAESSNAKVPESAPASGHRDRGDVGSTPASASTLDEDGLYRRFVERLLREAPAHLRVLTVKPELEVQVERRTVTANGSSLTGRIARLIAGGFFGETRRHTEIRKELERTGAAVHGGNLSRDLGKLVIDGFLTDEAGEGYRAVQDMKVNIVER